MHRNINDSSIFVFLSVATYMQTVAFSRIVGHNGCVETGSSLYHFATPLRAFTRYVSSIGVTRIVCFSKDTYLRVSSADITVCLRPPLMTQVQHFVSRVKKR